MASDDRYSKRERNEYNQGYWRLNKDRLREKRKSDPAKLRKKLTNTKRSYEAQLRALLDRRDAAIREIQREIDLIELQESKHFNLPPSEQPSSSQQ